MIGLVDYDLQTCQSSHLHPPNLEIMKLATYYKIERQQFCRLMPLTNEEDLTTYDKIYFFSEANVIPKVPERFLRADNVIYGGTAFTNGIYRPFEEELIDYTLPRPAIYKEFLKDKFNDGIKAKVISQILDDSYYRHYAGKEKLPLPAIRPKKRLWLYDTEFFQDGWREMVQEATDRKVSTINTIHPIVCHKLHQYFEMRTTPKISRANWVILDIGIPLEEVHYMFKEYRPAFLEDITNTSQVALQIGGTMDTSFRYYKDLIYKLNLLYSFWSQKVPIKLKYIPPRLGANCGITHLLQAVELWANSDNRDWTINDKICRKKMKTPTPEYEEELMILKFYPYAADLFTQNYNDLYRRGIWKV